MVLTRVDGRRPEMHGTLERGPLWHTDYLQTMVSVHPTLVVISNPLPDVDSGKTAGEST